MRCGVSADRPLRTQTPSKLRALPVLRFEALDDMGIARAGERLCVVLCLVQDAKVAGVEGSGATGHGQHCSKGVVNKGGHQRNAYE